MRCRTMHQLRNMRCGSIFYLLLVCSLSCSILLVLWSNTNLHSKQSPGLITGKLHKNEQARQFRTLFNDEAASVDESKKSDTTREEQELLGLREKVSSLESQLAFAQHSLYEANNKASGQAKQPGSQGGGGGTIKFKANIPKCQVLHIAIVCAGLRETRRVVTLIKSILFHRQHPLHFHFISDHAGRYVLKVLFDTWKLQQVFISFYDADKLKSVVDWIPNSHYSGVYGLMKLTLTKSLPDMIDRVIVLDTDVFFLTDIAQLWALFNEFTGEQAIGLVENQSDWYLGTIWKKYKHWPALGRGFNTGVMLLDLHKLRAIDWPSLWRLTAEKQLINLLSTVLADQDVINAALKDNPRLVFTLPCQWNIQLSDNTKSDDCYEDVTDLRIIHWNSPKKQGVAHKHAEYFRNMYMTFSQYDGNLLRREIFLCDVALDRRRKQDAVGGSTHAPEGFYEKDSTAPSRRVSDDDPCYDFAVEKELYRRVHLYFVDYNYEPTDTHDVTLLAHLSIDRLQILEPLLRHWSGPMSIALYASDAEALQFSRYASKSDAIKGRGNIGIHIVYKDGDLYPVNYLRNIALEHVKTKQVFLSDIDFLPDYQLYEKLKTISMHTNLRKRAYVVPAFETYQYKFEFPVSKHDLLELLDIGTVHTFRSSVWKAGHAATDFDKFKSANEDYQISWQRDFEPYVLVRKEDIPLYDMRFVGFGWNKVSHVMQMHAMGFELWVAAGTFIVHMPHAPSFDITKFRSNKNYRSCLRRLKNEFTQEIEQKYNIKFT